jgi:hypothetical protein
LVCSAPPSEPDWRISRIRLSGRWFYLDEDWNCGTVLTTSSFYFHSLKSIRGESRREWENILICAFTYWGDEGRGALEGIRGFEAIIGSKGPSSFGDLLGIGKDRKMEG